MKFKVLCDILQVASSSCHDSFPQSLVVLQPWHHKHLVHQMSRVKGCAGNRSSGDRRHTSRPRCQGLPAHITPSSVRQRGVACCQYMDLLPHRCCRQLFSSSQEHFGEFILSPFMKNKWWDATSASWSPSTVHQGTTSETLAPIDSDWKGLNHFWKKGRNTIFIEPSELKPELNLFKRLVWCWNPCDESSRWNCAGSRLNPWKIIRFQLEPLCRFQRKSSMGILVELHAGECFLQCITSSRCSHGTSPEVEIKLAPGSRIHNQGQT